MGVLRSPLRKPLARALARAFGGRSGGSIPDFTVAPTFAIYSIDNLLSDGRVVPNRYATSPPNGNIMSLSTGYIKSAGGGAVVDDFYALGPEGDTTAARVTFATDATVLQIYSGAPPAGNYTITFKVLLNEVGPTKDMRYGDTIPGLLTTTINASTWTTVTITNYAASGTTYDAVTIQPAVGDTLDILIDEIQWYPAADTIPAFADETNDWHLKVRNKGYTGQIARDGNLLNNSAGGAQGNVLNPLFPAAKTFTEITAIVAFRYETLGIGYMLVTETESALGTTANTFQIGTTNGTGIVGQIQFQPINQGVGRIEPLGEGWHLYAARFKTGAREVYFNGVELNSSAAAWSGFQARLLNIGGQASGTASKGDYGIVAVWDTYLSDADFLAAHEKVRYDVEQMGETLGAFPYFYMPEGDSNTANAQAAPNGPSYAYMLAEAGEFVGAPPLYMRNMATSGHGIADLETGKAALIAVAQQAIAAGAVPIVSVMVGTNDTAEIATDGYLAYWAKLESYYADLRAAGIKVVACTLIPASVGNPTWDAERAVLNAYMLTQTSAYDAIADLGGDPDIGPDAAPAALVYYYDTIHLNTAGHTIAAGLVKAAIESVMV